MNTCLVIRKKSDGSIATIITDTDTTKYDYNPNYRGQLLLWLLNLAVLNPEVEARKRLEVAKEQMAEYFVEVAPVVSWRDIPQFS